MRVIDNAFLYGYVAGEGCFSIAKQKNGASTYRNGLSPRFVVGCNRCELPILQALQRALGGIGRIYHEHDNHPTVQYMVTSRKSLKRVVIPFFDGNLNGGKAISFEKFKVAVALMDAKVHTMSREGFEMLCTYIDTINPSGKNMRKAWQEELSELDESEDDRDGVAAA